MVLQTGPESFQVLVGDGSPIEATLTHAVRRALARAGVTPLDVATEIVDFLDERGALAGPVLHLGSAAGRFPEFVEEIRARLG